jgi:sugar (pentulose or hexulose) kinase
MMAGWKVVLDVGKTLSKATLWDDAARCVATRLHANQALDSGSCLTLDIAGIERWLEELLNDYARLGPVDAIIPVAHGAGVALIRRGRLQCPPIDYEWTGVQSARVSYDLQRDPFDRTGSPKLPAGLNIGMQLHWLESLSSADFRSGHIVPWAQYWGWVLCGVLASEVTSLGCHTDLWRPYESTPSDLAVSRGWAERMAPLTTAHTVLGTLTPEWAARTGLSARVEVYCGMHDSNAALLHARQCEALKDRDSTVLSTGTWFVAMRSPLQLGARVPDTLTEARDCLVNVDVSGSPVPSSRFMGGREIELIGGLTSMTDPEGSTTPADIDYAIGAIESGQMILPSGVPGVGPYPSNRRSVDSTVRLINPRVMAQLYAALVADVSLDLIGCQDIVLVEGRFATYRIFVQALASLRPSTKILFNAGENGVARGALLLANVNAGASNAQIAAPLAVDATAYKHRWRDAAESLARESYR